MRSVSCGTSNFDPVWVYNKTDNSVLSLFTLQGMSEEAVRQTRSQKRALERDAAPSSLEPSNSDSESKKPKLDPSEPTTEAQTKPDPVLAEDDQSRTSDASGHDKDQEEEQSRLPLPLVLPLASRPVKDERGPQTDEPSSDIRTDCNDKASKANTEPARDTRSRVRLTEGKAPSGMMAAGEVKATIKVEVQTGEQPVDMSTSRGWDTVYSKLSSAVPSSEKAGNFIYTEVICPN